MRLQIDLSPSICTSQCPVAMCPSFYCRYKFYRENASSQATEGELYMIISNLKDAGYTVLGTVSDMGGGNQGLFNRLGVTDDKPYFEGLNAMDGDILYHLYDAVHLLKKIRDNLLDHGFYYNGTLLEKSMFERLLEEIGNSDRRIAHKLTEAHINVKKQDRLAFSNSGD